jgi:hypothetical protein
MTITENRETPLSHYDKVLCEARQKGELIANKYIFELYTFLGTKNIYHLKIVVPR